MLLYQELKDALSSHSHELKEVKREVSALNHVEPPPKDEFLSYTVKKGDSLAKIASEYYGSFEYYQEIAKLNNLTHPFILRSGDKLKLKISPDFSLNENLSAERL